MSKRILKQVMQEINVKLRSVMTRYETRDIILGPAISVSKTQQSVILLYVEPFEDSVEEPHQVIFRLECSDKVLKAARETISERLYKEHVGRVYRCEGSLSFAKLAWRLWPSRSTESNYRYVFDTISNEQNKMAKEKLNSLYPLIDRAPITFSQNNIY